MKTSSHRVTPASLLLPRVEAVSTLWTADLKTPEQVHDLRVAIRRLRVAIHAFRLELPVSLRLRCESALRLARRRLGAVRDWDVALCNSKDHEDASKKQIERADRRRRKALNAAYEAMRSSSWIEKLQMSVLEIPADLDVEVIGSVDLDERYAALSDCLEIEGSKSALHRLRISIRKLRYTLELFQDVIKPKKRTLAALKLLRRLQEQLGELNDPQSVAEMLDRSELNSRNELPQGLLKELGDLAKLARARGRQ